jgi:mersacidin/lichenicidin family type 2 lantibiotic
MSCVTQKETDPMSQEMLIRAWKDEEYRLSLSEAERALLPENPAGGFELSDAELDAIVAGSGCPTINCNVTFIICIFYSVVCNGTFIF